MIIKLDTDFTFEEADNLAEALLIHFGFAGFTNQVYVGNKKVFDINNKKDQEWLDFTFENRIKRMKNREKND